MDSGVVTVVRVASRGLPSRKKPIVPIIPVRRPAARRAASSRNVVVVFPLVPVTAYMVMASAGRSKIAAATPAISRRGSVTTTSGTARGPASCAPATSVSTAGAPSAMAWAANSAPWCRRPGSATYRSPGWTSRESWVMPLMSTGPARGNRSVSNTGRAVRGRSADGRVSSGTTGTLATTRAEPGRFSRAHHSVGLGW